MCQRKQLVKDIYYACAQTVNLGDQIYLLFLGSWRKAKNLDETDNIGKHLNITIKIIKMIMCCISTKITNIPLFKLK